MPGSPALNDTTIDIILKASDKLSTSLATRSEPSKVEDAFVECSAITFIERNLRGNDALVHFAGSHDGESTQVAAMI